jgi:hypothetical protein
MRIWTEEDPATQKIVALRIRSYAWSVERTIWMDGRPHPSKNARHTWQGFSTGVWNSGTLTVTTTHLKWNYIRRNGVPRSDEATVTEHFERHGDYLTLLTYIDDPLYPTEPLLRRRTKPAAINAKPMAPRESCACPRGYISRGWTTARCAWTPMREHRLDCSISGIPKLRAAIYGSKALPRLSGNSCEPRFHHTRPAPSTAAA